MYGGDSNFAASTSKAVKQVVEKFLRCLITSVPLLSVVGRMVRSADTQEARPQSTGGAEEGARQPNRGDHG